MSRIFYFVHSVRNSKANNHENKRERTLTLTVNSGLELQGVSKLLAYIYIYISQQICKASKLSDTMSTATCKIRDVALIGGAMNRCEYHIEANWNTLIKIQLFF